VFILTCYERQHRPHCLASAFSGNILQNLYRELECAEGLMNQQMNLVQQSPKSREGEWSETKKEEK
jgi:hypothetical protein